MTALASGRAFDWRGWRNARAASARFQSWASAFPLTRRIARRDGMRLFDLVSGFVYSQIVLATVELDLPARLARGAMTAEALAPGTGIAPDRLAVLLQGAASLGLLERMPDGAYRTARLGAALGGVPGLAGMVRHHGAFYRDLGDPLALLRGDAETELAGFWPYVFGAGVGDAEAARYSRLMAESQALVAEETLRAVSLRRSRHLMDVGGGTGAFLAAVAAKAPRLALTLVDLPEVLAAVPPGRVRLAPGDFRHDPLPTGADTISLVRVLYDHADATVAALLGRVFAALAPGGRLIVSEPMAGGARPERAGDAYFAFYTLAMRTGRARSAAEIGAFLASAGFADVKAHRTRRPFVTSVVTARKPA